MSAGTIVPGIAAGTAYDQIDHALRGYREYRAFLRGSLDRAGYCRWINSGAVTAEGLGLTEDQLNLSSRFPVDETAYVDRCLRTLRDAGVIESTRYPEREFTGIRRRIDEQFAHGGRTTYIFPEEARLLFALAHLLAPRHTAFPGSYYGYWAVWALPGIQAAGGRAVLIDIDESTMELARHNIEALGLAGGVEFRVADAIADGPGLPELDLCVLDAEGPRTGAPEDLTDKAIYYPIMAATTPRLRPGGVLVAHNMLLENLTTNGYFDGRVANNRRQYAKFHAHLDEHYDVQRTFATSEGVGVYRRRVAAPAGDR
ncbi:class I SAM-dependent methyltransferase [Actinoplanes sp. NPDC051411]|jgi:predicted O-methyltransferase YrrM|uniref:O-methyltransferase n=1 Tax=Actinoplanes sp. NPDC051411 TaxID=3155522 RepID=UPI00341D82A9